LNTFCVLGFLKVGPLCAFLRTLTSSFLKKG